ncbi:MAG: tail fiber protein [Myxococcales bacterium]|nr:tail fiber protein [Myxococcales bacterium]
MSDPFVGEVRMFGGNFAPRGWAFCDGQLLAVSQNDALFSLLGTLYGGDGRTTFGLPDMRGRLPVHAGDGPGLQPINMGQKAGVEKVTLQVSQLPSHRHTMRASNDVADESTPSSAVVPAQVDTVQLYRAETSPNATFATRAVADAGGSQPHSNLQPFLCVHFIIALLGVYPSRH